MKNLKTLALAFTLALGTVVSAQKTKQIDVTKSSIHWVGKKFTGKHEGTINIQGGTLVLKGKKLIGGIFTVDMNSISVTDLEAGKGKEKLEDHLKDDDFFGTEKFSSSKLVFKSIGQKNKNTYNITADLTIKGITNPIKFEMSINGNKATTNLKVDRTKYDIKYGSTLAGVLADKAISDDFELDVVLVF